jgi:hypothetical protein
MRRRALLLAAIAGLLLAANDPTKEKPGKPAILTWVGPAGGNWSVAANWSPAQVPETGDILWFDADRGADTDSTVDLGGGGFSHIARLNIAPTYTKTITLQCDLRVDVLAMAGGTIAGNKNLVIWQKAAGEGRPPTNFGTSTFSGGTIKSNMFTIGEDRHRVTLVLAGGKATPELQANLTTDAYTALGWRAGNVTVAGGTTVKLKGFFLADSPGAMGNPTANWFLAVEKGAALAQAKGVFDHGKVLKNGGDIFNEVLP